MLLKKSTLVAISISLLSLAAQTVKSDGENWSNSKEWSDDEWQQESNWQWSGFAELAYGQRLQTDQLFTSKQTLNETRLHIESDYSGEEVNFSFKTDFWYDVVTNDIETDLRELSIDFSIFGNTDLKIGRQVTTWGTGDLLFLNDLFPKDWQSFFSGREQSYLKAPANAVRISSYFDALNIDLVWTPQFEPDRYIDGERFSLFSPLMNQQIGGQDLVNPVEPNKSISNGELALRLYKTIKGTEYAIYAYRGFEKEPNGLTPNLVATFHRKNVFGASIRGSIAEGIYNLEIAYHAARKDKQGTNPLVKNSQWRFLLGYEKELAPRLTWSGQYYLEQTQNYNELIVNSLAPEFEPKESRQLITNRISYRAMQDKLTWSLFMFYSPSDKDSYWRPSINYRHDDDWSLMFGANLFKGEKVTSFFGQFEDATNAYLRLRYSF